MREMNARERLIFYFSVPCCLLLVYSLVSRHISRTMDREVGAFEEAESKLDRLNKSIAEIPEAPKKEEKKVESEVAGPEKRHEASLFLFREITTRGEFEGIRIVSTEKVTDRSYRVVLNGEFAAMVRWLTFFERPDGLFVVNSASLAPSEGDPTKPKKDLVGTFEVKLKG